MATDPFDGTNGDPLSGNWTTVQGGWRIYSNMANETTGATPNIARYTGASFANDHYSKATIGGASAGGGVGVRLSAGGNGYHVRHVSGGGSVNVSRLDAGVETQLGEPSVSIGENDVIELRATGDTIAAYVNGSPVTGGSFTDGTYSGGAPGITAFANNGILLDDWEGLDIGGGPADLNVVLHEPVVGGSSF